MPSIEQLHRSIARHAEQVTRSGNYRRANWVTWEAKVGSTAVRSVMRTPDVKKGATWLDKIRDAIDRKALYQLEAMQTGTPGTLKGQQFFFEHTGFIVAIAQAQTPNRIAEGADAILEMSKQLEGIWKMSRHLPAIGDYERLNALLATAPR